MKKIITTLAFLALGSTSVMSADIRDFNISGLSLTAGLASNTSVWGASAKETNYSETGTLPTINKEHGVFTESYGSQFVELGIGRFISLGYEMTSDSITTPTNISKEGDQKNTVSVDFNDLNTVYAKLNIPGGMYVKYGSVSTDLDIKETMASGNTYANVSVDGTSIGAGYQRLLGDTGFGFRFEANYLEFDNTKTDNGVATSGNHNLIEATGLEGAAAKFAVTYTFGRD
jgi:hypothetical protein